MAAGPGRSAAPIAKVWATSAMEKIRPSEPARLTSVAKIAAARNEFEAFQVVITGSARKVRATASTLVGPGGAQIAAPRLHREALLNLTRASAPDGATGRFPDALVPDVDEIAGERRNAFPFDIRGAESRAIWAEVFVPPGAAPGSIAVRSASSSRAERHRRVELTVWDFDLPSTATLRSAFSLAWGALPSGHGISASDVAAFASLRARCGQLALDHRLTLSHHDDGMWGDLDHFDRYYGPLMEGTAPTQLAGAKLTTVEYLGNLEDTAAMTRWATHYRARPGWFERLFQYTCDEPPYQGCGFAEIARRAQAVKAADPEFRTLVTTTIDEAEANGVSGLLDLIVPVVNFMDDKSGGYAGNQRASYDAFLASDPLNEVWLYQSCMSHGCGGGSHLLHGLAELRGRRERRSKPRHAVARVQVRGHGRALLGHDLRVPLRRSWTTVWEFDGNGDGTLSYQGTPAKIGGTTHVPVASIRLKMIREGMEDYEYLTLLAAARGSRSRQGRREPALPVGLADRAERTEPHGSARADREAHPGAAPLSRSARRCRTESARARRRARLARTEQPVP